MRIAIVSAAIVGMFCVPAMAMDFFEGFDNTNFYKPDGGALTAVGNDWNGYWNEFDTSASPAIDYDGGYGGGNGVSTDGSGYYGAYLNGRASGGGPELFSPAVGADAGSSKVQVHGHIYMDTTGTDYREGFLELRTDPNVTGQGFGEAGERYLRVGYVANDPAEGGLDYYFFAWKDDDGSGIKTSLDSMTGLNVYEDPNDRDLWANFGLGYYSWQDPDAMASNIDIMVFEDASPGDVLFTAGWWPTTVDIANPGLLNTFAFNGTGDTVAWDNLGAETVVPEPGAIALLLFGGLAVLRRRR